jgi:Domain of unknown function (DUF1992)
LADTWLKPKKPANFQNAKSYGKPLDLGDGYKETPAELRMGFKMLKDSGFVPPEVELMQQIHPKRQALVSALLGSVEETALRRRLTELETNLALAKSRLRG